MSKTIWHVGAWGQNFGDRVLQVANTNILKERCKEDLQFVYIDIQKTYFSEQLIDKMNAEADLLLIGGGGLIFNRSMDNSHSGWQFNLDTENIDKIKVPIAVYAIGYNKFPYDTHIFPQTMWENLNAMVKKSNLFSVRNGGTYRAMKEHGVCMDKVDIVPDAGMFIKPDTFQHKLFEGDHVKIGLNWATDRPDQRFKDIDTSLLAMTRMLKTCKSIADKHDGKVYIIEHLLENDLCTDTKRELHIRAKNILGDRAVLLYEELYEELFPPFDYTVGFFADIYKQMDLVFGSRGHANIIPFGQNTPFIGIGAHNKVKWFLEDIGLGKYFVSLDDPKDMDKAMLLADEILSNPEINKKQMAAALSTLTNTKNIFIDKIVDLL